MKTLTPALSPAHRKALKAQAHALNPVVMIGNDGLTEAVLREIDRALDHHELIKIRVLGDERDARKDILAEICEALEAAPVQHIGKILVVHRENPDKHLSVEKPMAQRVTKKTMRKSGEPADQREHVREVDKRTSPPRRQPRQTLTKSAGRRTKRSFQR